MSTTVKDLTSEAPRSPRIRIGGYAILSRTLDKGRSTLAEKAGEYHFDCPLDKVLFGFKGVTGDEIRTLLVEGKSDEEIVIWLNTHGTPKSAEEITAWSNGFEAVSPYQDPEKKEWFSGECTRLGIEPATSTITDLLEADDKQSFA